MEVKGYKQQGEQVYSLYNADTILDYMEEMTPAEILVIEPMEPDSEEVKVYFMIREDGEQLGLNIKDKG